MRYILILALLIGACYYLYNVGSEAMQQTQGRATHTIEDVTDVAPLFSESQIREWEQK